MPRASKYGHSRCRSAGAPKRSCRRETVPGRALNRLEGRHPLTEPFELLVDLAGGDSGLTPAHFEPLVLAERGRGADADLDREGQRLPLLRGLAHVELGLAHGRDPGSLDGVGIPAAKRAPERLVEHRLTSQAPDHDGRRHLALAETGNPHLAPELPSCLGYAALDLLGGNLGLNAHA